MEEKHLEMAGKKLELSVDRLITRDRPSFRNGEAWFGGILRINPQDQDCLEIYPESQKGYSTGAFIYARSSVD